jgi:LacI family transcriptional regulator
VGKADLSWINEGDGLIFQEPLATSPVKSPQWSVPAVAVQRSHRAGRYPLVTTDYHQVGRRAASYLLKKGLTHLAYLSYRYGDAAEAGFRDWAKETGRQVTSHYLGPGKPELDAGARSDLVRWLAELLPPVGVLVRDDFLAQKVMDWIPQEWMPERLALLGIGNDSIICELTRPSLSSVERNAREIGRAAARLLDRIMAGERVPPQPFLFDPGQVIERQSTGLSYTPDPFVTRAVRILEEHLADAPSTEELCNRLKVSRSTLENRFRDTLGHSIWKHRQHLQIERAKYLLATTTDSMSAIAERCGFSNQQRLAESFRKFIGVTPSRYRARHRLTTRKTIPCDQFGGRKSP